MLGEHPSKEIICEESAALRGRRVVLGVTSSVAIYRSIDLARTLMRRGAEVVVVMSRDAAKLISPTLFEWATGNRVFHTEFGGEVGHVALASSFDGMLIAPATANTISKLAYGVADTPVVLAALAFLGAGKPLMVVPAMHLQLLNSKPVQEALTRLEGMGVIVHPPKVEKGRAKLPEVWEIAWRFESLLLRGADMRGLKVLVTAGPTREYIDGVRFITNASSGRMGVAIAHEALFRGASVSLVHGPLSGVSHYVPRSRAVETTSEMVNAVEREMVDFDPDLIFLAAAPVDFAPLQRLEGKAPSNKGYIIELTPTPKVAEVVARRRRRDSVLVVFSAEVVDDESALLQRAAEKMNKYLADIVVANNVGRRDIGFSSEYNEVLIYDGSNVLRSGRGRKEEIARLVVDVALKKLKEVR